VSDLGLSLLDQHLARCAQPVARPWLADRRRLDADQYRDYLDVAHSWGRAMGTDADVIERVPFPIDKAEHPLHNAPQ
jgi:hypothetical protein